MTYDADGLRSSKTVGTRKTEYQYVGDKLFYEKRGDNQTFYYFYDSYGNLAMIRYTLVGSDNSVSTATYLVQTNSQGDVVALYKKSGELYARYEYDAWGNTLSITDASGNPITAWYHIANANPIRYRGYYFDADLNLYYLQSRYYDSEIGRFINSDNVTDPGAGLLGYNTFIYCANNPVNAVDPSGHFILSAILVGFAVGAVTSMISEAACQLADNIINDTAFKPKEIIKAGIIGGICGAISGGIGGAIAKTGASVLAKGIANVIADGCVNVIGTSLNAICDKKSLSAGDYIYSFASGVASSSMGKLASGIKQNSNIRTFDSLSKNKQKTTLNSLSNGQHITRTMINNNDYLTTGAYDSFISSGTKTLENAVSSAATISFELIGSQTL